MQIAEPIDERRALASLIVREEVLQICYWYQGEGFGAVFAATALRPFLNSNVEQITAALDDLTGFNLLEKTDGGFTFTEAGRKEAARLFADAFADFKQGGHGECPDGCCDGMGDEFDHSNCNHG
jgi:hypothetical protein